MDAEYQGVDDRTLSNLDITPAQFYDEVHRPSWRSGEHNLLWAVLINGLNCWLRRLPPPTGCSTEFRETKRGRMWAEANHWIYNDPSTDLFSFTSICEQLDIDIDALRRDLPKWRGKAEKLPRCRKIVTRSQAIAA